ncbi:hypothetical protein ACERK3_19140 [Phycisphaerales bacterium AB-hyl4]|uniref:Uncharacterized protein n=1 Tax=Natronomicrosphaera hydrolytica TaxID=3242702 RepID=A0ABV4U9U9_9BACT
MNDDPPRPILAAILLTTGRGLAAASLTASWWMADDRQALGAVLVHPIASPLGGRPTQTNRQPRATSS